MNSPKTGQGRSRRLLYGISGRLMLALFCLSVLPILAAVVGWVSKRNIEVPLEEAVARNLSFSDTQVQARALSQMLFGLLIYDLEDGEEFVSERRERARSLVTQFETLAPQLDKAAAGFGDQVPTSGLGSFTESTFADTVTEISQATQQVVRLVSEDADVHRTIAAKTATISEVVARVENVTAQGDRLGGAIYEKVLDIRSGARRLKVLAGALVASDFDNGVSVAATDYAATLRDMISVAATLQNGAIRESLAPELAKLYELGNAGGESSLFSSVRSANQSHRQLLVTQRNLQKLREQLNMQLIVVEEANNTSVRDLVVRAEAGLARTLAWLIATAIVSVVVALGFSYFYVYHVLLRRFRRLSDATMKLGRGDLDVALDHGGEDELSDIAGALEVFRDRSVRLRENEQSLVARTEELEQVNAELDKFAYVASHDLRAPLRAVENLAGFLIEDLDGTIPAESRKHLGMMLQRIQRLDALLSSLLEYSRIGRVKQPMERFDVLECISDCVQIVRDEHFEVSVTGASAVIFTYRTPLELVLRNLIDNAQKHHDKEHGSIAIDVKRVGGEMLINITDDGQGIPVKFQERIFEMFQTLKPRDDTEGSGMGLAILLKTIDAYGGRVRIESDPDKQRGTTFFVSWPVFDAHNLPETAITADTT